MTKIWWVGILLAFLAVAYGFLPAAADHPLPTAFATGIATLYSWLYGLNTILPVDVAILVFTTFLLIEVWMHLGWKFIHFLVRWIGNIN